MFCAISGEPPQHPVISSKTGHIYEKALIEKYIADNGKCPVTGEEMSQTDLIEVKMLNPVVKPRPPTLTSIPSILSVLQNEWDSVMLETYELKKQQQELQQELSHALYQHDAACRVISRLMQERDDARNALLNFKTHQGQVGDEASEMEMDTAVEQKVETEEIGLTAKIMENINLKAKELSKTRRKRKAPAELVQPEVFSEGYHVLHQGPSLHSAKTPGITCVALIKNKEAAVTGGKDGHLQVYRFDQEEGQVECVIKTQQKKIRDVVHCVRGEDELIFCAGSEKSTLCYQRKESESEFTRVWASTHEDDVVSICLHPTEDYLFSFYAHGSWTMAEAHNAHEIVTMKDQSLPKTTCGKIHPDGLILVSGSKDGVIRIWEIKTQQCVASLSGHSGEVSSLSFSENGYYLASASKHEVKVWDLRKSIEIQGWDMPEDFGSISKVHFDYSGQYMAVSGNRIAIYQTKRWKELGQLDAHKGIVSDFAFGPHARYLVSVGMDRHLIVSGVSLTSETSS